MGANNKAYTYEGLDSNHVKNLGDDTKLLRQTIIDKKELMRKEFGNDSDITVLIKPTPECSYANVINALDEMLINNIKTYVMVDADANETILTKNK